MPASRSSLIFPLVKIWSNQTLELLDGATCWDDVRCPANNAGPAASNPTYASFMNDGLGSIGVYEPRFTDPGPENDLMFDMQVPHAYKLGTAFHPHIHWSPDDAGAGNVGWGIEYCEANIDEVFPNTQFEVLAFSTTSTAKKHITSGWSDVIKPTRNISAMFKARVFRTNSGGIDTYSGFVWLHEFDVHYEINTLGSRTEYVK